MMNLPYQVSTEQLAKPTIQIGQIAQQQNAKGDGYRVPLWDISGPMIQRIQKELDTFIEKNLEESEHFYVVMRLHKPPDSPNAIRALYFARRTACAPEPGLSLIEVNGCTGEITWHWTLPDIDTIQTLYMAKHLVDPSEKELLQNVVDYVEGRLGVDELHKSDKKEKR